MIPDPDRSTALWLQFPGPSGTAEWLVHPDDHAPLLELGEIHVNGLRATVHPPGAYAIRPNVVILRFEDGVTAANAFDPWTTDQLRHARPSS